MSSYSSYLNWLKSIVIADNDDYNKLVDFLDTIVFECRMSRDQNRVQDGIDLRQLYEKMYCEKIRNPADCVHTSTTCSVLELMVGIAKRCEDTIMHDILYGDRTYVWFYEMLDSMKLLMMTDDNFNEQYVLNQVAIMINRSYDYYGHGGLFTVMFPSKDMRSIEIWDQLHEYLNEQHIHEFI